jgi:hypothetical protein
MTWPTGSMPEPAVIDGVNVDDVATAVLACAGVAGLDGGQFGEVASYLPGRRIPGVVVSGGRVRVQIRIRWAARVPPLVALIIAVLRPLTRDRPVDVVIADIDDPPGAREQPLAAAGSSGLAGRRPA